MASFFNIDIKNDINSFSATLISDQTSSDRGPTVRALVVLVNRISIRQYSLSTENRNSSSFLQKSILEPLIIAPKNLLNNFKLSLGIVQYGSHGSPIVNVEIRKISPLNVAIRAPVPEDPRRQRASNFYADLNVYSFQTLLCSWVPLE